MRSNYLFQVLKCQACARQWIHNVRQAGVPLQYKREHNQLETILPERTNGTGAQGKNGQRNFVKVIKGWHYHARNKKPLGGFEAEANMIRFVLWKDMNRQYGNLVEGRWQNKKKKHKKKKCKGDNGGLHKITSLGLGKSKLIWGLSISINWPL